MSVYATPAEIAAFVIEGIDEYDRANNERWTDAAEAADCYCYAADFSKQTEHLDEITPAAMMGAFITIQRHIDSKSKQAKIEAAVAKIEAALAIHREADDKLTAAEVVVGRTRREIEAAKERAEDIRDIFKPSYAPAVDLARLRHAKARAAHAEAFNAYKQATAELSTAEGEYEHLVATLEE